MSKNSADQKASKADSLIENIEGNQSELYPFFIKSPISQRVPFELKPVPLYNISYCISEEASISNSVLSFSYEIQQPINFENFKGYEIYFTKDLLDNESVILVEKLKLLSPQNPVTFSIKHNQEWRINEIFENMLIESAKTDLYRNEMIKTLIHVLILLALRMLPDDTKSVYNL